MKKKIIITGGLGYIGTELCKIYSGYSWKDSITVIDNRFISKRIYQLRKWNIEFVHGDILDKKLIEKYCSNADVVHHLAGITDVPRTKGESNKKHEKLIERVGVKGTQNIIDAVSQNCKIIMPSSHVIFEGIKKVKRNILENEITYPKLAYGKSKDKNEKQLKASGKNYIILRLGSVYGFSNDTMRIDIMTNLFSKIASQNGIIKLFGGGNQLKSLVPLIDVARCFKFMEERNDLNYETFNLTKDAVNVKHVAQICKKYSPKIKIVNTKDQVPNLGFSLSNKKILKTGFKFLYGLEESIKEMINNWSKNQNDTKLYEVTKGQNEFIDNRGKISNYELTEPINMIGLIHSRKNTVRANHYHPQQEQKCLFIKGQIIEVYKDLLNKNAPKITQVVNEGEISTIKPNVAHSMIFSRETVFLNLVRGEREHDNYGITHTKQFDLINDQEKNLLLSIYKFECRSCGNSNLKRVISLGYQPLANNLLKNKNDKEELYPLELNFCDKCFNCQLSVAVDSKKLFKNYLYTSSTSEKFRNHFENSCKKYIKDLKLSKNKSTIFDIGSNDGIALRPFKKAGFKKILGIEPAANLAKIANKEKISTLNIFLNKKNLKKIKKKADLVLASNVFAHSDNLNEMAECMLKILKPNGVIVIEVQYLLNTLKDLTFDNIYHEHYNYWSLTSLVNFFTQFNVTLYKAEKIDTHGGSIRIFLKKSKNVKIHKSVKIILNEEEKFGIKKFSTYQRFEKKVLEIKKNIINNINELKKKNSKLIGFGAPAKATTALNFYGITNQIDYVVEDNLLKVNKFIPGVKIPIISKNKLSKHNNTIIVLAWNFFKEIKKKNFKLADRFINIKSLEKKYKL
jgi:nucleoside-diphosphate-sugar epimerase/SAM-dependent methyltransferase/dTDP-4-dehydrorhamnose 3,5-epimerase-like enzyme